MDTAVLSAYYSNYFLNAQGKGKNEHQLLNNYFFIQSLVGHLHVKPVQSCHTSSVFICSKLITIESINKVPNFRIISLEQINSVREYICMYKKRCLIILSKFSFSLLSVLRKPKNVINGRVWSGNCNKFRLLQEVTTHFRKLCANLPSMAMQNEMIQHMHLSGKNC